MKKLFTILFLVYISIFTIYADIAPDTVLTPDSAITLGKLPNGLTYYIRPNGYPENQVFLRLVVKSGSVMEDDDQLGLEGVDVLEDSLHGGLTDNVKPSVSVIVMVIVIVYSVGTHFDLLFALFAADVEEREGPGGQGQGGLEKEGALADARLAAEEEEGTGDDAAAQHTVELGTVGGDALCGAVGHLVEESRLGVES